MNPCRKPRRSLKLCSRVEQISGPFEPLIMEEIVVALLSTDRLGHRAPDPVQTLSGTLKRDVGFEQSSENRGCALPVLVRAAEHLLSVLQLRHSCVSHSGLQGIWCISLIATQMENLFGDDVNDILLLNFHDRFLDLSTEVRAGQKAKLAAAPQRRRKRIGDSTS